LRRIDRIALEYHDYLFQGHSYLELKNFLENNGFKVKVGGSFFDRKIFRLGLLYAQKQD
jgi:hypothetical protein